MAIVLRPQICDVISPYLYTGMPCSNAANTRNPLKFTGVPQTRQQISAASGPKFTILWGHVEDILLLNKYFFPIVDTCLSCEDIARQSCGTVPRLFGDFLHLVFPARRAQHISDLHPKFALRPHQVPKYGRQLRPLRLGEEKKKERKKKIETTRQKYNGLPYYVGRS